MPQTTDRPAQRRARSVVVRDRRGSGMRRMLGAVSADARMLRAISADVAHAADPRHLASRPPAADPFELRDPEYIARTLPALRVMADVWFRADVRGLENIPPRGPVLLVGNHSGGTSRAAPHCLSIRAATTRPTGPVGTLPRSTSPTGPASCGSR